MPTVDQREAATNAAGTPAQRFLRDAASKSADLVHREIIRFNMDSYHAAHQKGRLRINDWETARRRCQEIKREAINHLDRYLLQFEEKVIAHGGHGYFKGGKHRRHRRGIRHGHRSQLPDARAGNFGEARRSGEDDTFGKHFGEAGRIAVIAAI